VTIPSHSFEQYTVAFYNLENLFDFHRNRYILDKDFTEAGKKKWDEARYLKKLDRLSNAISRVGYQETMSLPEILGVAEVENKKVLQDLINQPKLKGGHYDFIHYDGPDERGIDVALIYNKRVFQEIESYPITVHLEDERGVRDTTRDILYVHGNLAGCPVDIYVNHWPSRRDGVNDTNNKRVEVATQLRNHLEQLELNPDRRRIILGDFNDEPQDESLMILKDQNLFNVTADLKMFHRGSVNHKFKWSLFDQILISDNLINDEPEELYFYKANIYDDIMLRQWKGKYRGQPSRSFVGNHYMGGYSDHFPVYAIFRRN
jgi:predicted extracellular nuclease